MPVNASNDNLNWNAPGFRLQSVDSNFYSLKDLVGVNGTVIAFICNHCPYVIEIIRRFVSEANEMKKIGINTIAIMPNDVSSYPKDSYNNMKLFAKMHDFNFQYLYDESQITAKKYNAVCTPDIFGFNKFNKLKYRGRIDSKVMKENKIINRELFYAMELIAKTNEGPSIQMNSFGCSIKWKNNE